MAASKLLHMLDSSVLEDGLELGLVTQAYNTTQEVEAGRSVQNLPRQEIKFNLGKLVRHLK